MAGAGEGRQAGGKGQAKGEKQVQRQDSELFGKDRTYSSPKNIFHFFLTDWQFYLHDYTAGARERGLLQRVKWLHERVCGERPGCLRQSPSAAIPGLALGPAAAASSTRRNTGRARRDKPFRT